MLTRHVYAQLKVDVGVGERVREYTSTSAPRWRKDTRREVSMRAYDHEHVHACIVLRSTALGITGLHFRL